ncbi:hypothetical protein D3C76_1264730 [compost metagenome]
MRHCQAQRTARADILVDRSLQSAASTAVPARVVAALADGFIEVAIAFGGVAIAGEAQIGVSGKRLAVLQCVAHALQALGVPTIDVGAGVGQVQGQRTEGA